MFYPKYKPVTILFTYEDFKNLGGTNKVVMSQINVLHDNSISSIVICPLQLPFGIGKNRWLVRIDGRKVLVKNNAEILCYLETLKKNGYFIRGIIIHHLKNIKLTLLSDFLSFFDGEILFYLHDYYLICPFENGNFLRNDGCLCPAGRLLIKDCSNCGAYEKSHSEELEAFICRFSNRLLFISPSEECKTYFEKHLSRYNLNIKVIPHQILVESDSCEKKHLQEKIKIAFVGSPLYSKGWNDFKDLVISTKKTDQYYIFYSFCKTKEQIDNVTFVDVDFHKDLNAMTTSLKKNNIDVALLLSKWPETYSYTYYECFCANCFVLCYNVSGNIMRQVSKRKNGLVFSSKEEMIQYLLSGNIKNDIESFFSNHNKNYITRDDRSFIELLKTCVIKSSTKRKLFSFSLIYKYIYLIKQVFRQNS